MKQSMLPMAWRCTGKPLALPIPWQAWHSVKLTYVQHEPGLTNTF